MSKVNDGRSSAGKSRRMPAASLSVETLLLFKGMLDAMTLSASAPNFLEMANHVDQARRELSEALRQVSIAAPGSSDNLPADSP